MGLALGFSLLDILMEFSGRFHQRIPMRPVWVSDGVHIHGRVGIVSFD